MEQSSKKPIISGKALKGVLFLLIAISLYNLTVQTFFNNPESIQPRTKSITTTPKKEKSQETINFQLKKRNYIDSLIDNKILTPENLKKADDLYPDSLCHC